MYKLNVLQYPVLKDISIDSSYSLAALSNNENLKVLLEEYKNRFSFSSLNTLHFSKESLLGFLLGLDGDIAVSLGESEALIEASKAYKKLGFNLDFIPINKNGQLDYESIKDKYSYIFVSSYIMDTYVKVDLFEVKKRSKAKIIGNISATLDCTNIDIAFLDAYKLSGYASSSVLLHNDLLEKQVLGEIDIISLQNIIKTQAFSYEKENKSMFINALKKELKDDFFFFVDPFLSLENTLHFGLKNIKAREIIRALSLYDIFTSNGEGCSLGLMKPSRILQEMLYSENDSRQALSFSFTSIFSKEDIDYICKIISKVYRQIKVLND
ncbi:MAG: cysteine desulfurase [Arcobacter sp.]|nr:MAG: cysteine desulfurase [Arcobacter sp.]